MTRQRAEVAQAEAGMGLAKTKRMLNLAEVSSLTPVQQPTPAIKDGPSRGKIAITGLLIGLFIGLGFAFVRTITDRVVRGPEDLEDLNAGPVLATLPIAWTRFGEWSPVGLLATPLVAPASPPPTGAAGLPGAHVPESPAASVIVSRIS